MPQNKQMQVAPKTVAPASKAGSYQGFGASVVAEKKAARAAKNPWSPVHDKHHSSTSKTY